MTGMMRRVLKTTATVCSVCMCLGLSVQAMARNQDAIDDIRAHAPALRNSFLFLISDWTYEDIATLEGKERLRAEMLNGAKAILQANTGNPSIEEIYFTSLVVQ